MSKKVVKATLVKCNRCQRTKLVQSVQEEEVNVTLAGEGWHLLNGKDLCSENCFQITLSKTPADFPYWSY